LTLSLTQQTVSICWVRLSGLLASAGSESVKIVKTQRTVSIRWVWLSDCLQSARSNQIFKCLSLALNTILNEKKVLGNLYRLMIKELWKKFGGALRQKIILSGLLASAGSHFLAIFGHFFSRIQIFWKNSITTTSSYTKTERWWKNQKFDPSRVRVPLRKTRQEYKLWQI